MSNTESNTTLPEIPVGIDEGLLEWANYHLGKIELKAANVKDDLDDGFFLVMLIEMVTKDKFGEYHSRTFAETPISEKSIVEFNQKALRDWFAKLKIREESIVVDVEYQDLVKAILWYLVGKSVGHGGNLGKKCRARYETARKLYEIEKSPFPFQGLGLEEKGSVVLLRTCILLDKLKIARENIKDKKVKKWVSAPQKYETVKPLEIKFKEERVIRVFLSSTFRDMQQERDEFFMNAVPELKRRAKEQGIELVFIDLRWGLTSEDSNGGWVVIRCLDSIAKCPYFVCSLGARYGWIPDQNKTELNMQIRLDELLKTKLDATMKDIWVEWHSETNARFPFIKAMPGLSVTEYEIQFACLIDKPACSRAFFYLRDEEYAVKNAKNEEEKKLFQAENEEARKRQERLKNTVKSKFGHVVYKGAKEYADFVASHLAYAIEKDFGNETVRDPEDQAQHQFKMHRLAGFGGRVELLKKITEEVMAQLKSEGSKITVLAAESGIGKSSLMAATARDLEAMNLSNMSIFFHFVGCTNLSNYVESVSIRFWTLVTKMELFVGQKKSETEFEKEGLNGLLQMIQGKTSDQQFVFLIDAINQIHSSQGTPAPHLLTWLPKATPQNVAMVVSTIHTHDSYKSVEESGLDVIPVTKLTKDEIKEGTQQFLKLYDKSLSEVQVGMILDDFEDTGHPLYLRIVLDEIRVFGVYEQLNVELESLLSTNGVIDLYTLVITRWQKKFDKDALLYDGKEKKKIDYVSISMKVLYVSRIGLSEGDMDVFMKDTIGQGFELPEWKSFFFTLIESLFVRNGRYMYFHQLLLETTEKFYVGDKEEKVKTHEYYGKWLFAKYSEDENVDEELAAEICYQLLQGQSFELLVDYLRQKHVVIIMLGGRYRYEFFNCWRAINEKGIANYTDVYRNSVKSLDKEGGMLVDFFLESFENSFLLSVLTSRIGKRTREESKATDYLTLGRVYKNLQNWTESMNYYNKCLEVTNKSEENVLSVATIHEEMGFIFQQENKIDKSLVEYKKSLGLRVKHLGENDLQVAQCYDRFGDIYIMQKRLEDKAKSEKKAAHGSGEKKDEEGGNESLTEKALAEYQKSMEIRQKRVGNEHPLVATSFQNYGRVSLTEKKYEEAIGYYEKAKLILEKSLGNKHASVATTIQYIAKVHVESGKKQEALTLLTQSVAIYVSALGENHPNVVSCYDLIGDISHDLEDFKGALAAYTKTLDIRKRTLGEKHLDYVTSLENVGRTNFELQSSAQAIDLFQKAAIIRKETKTAMSLRDAHQIGNIIRLMKEKKEQESVIQLYKTLVHLFSQLYSLDYLGIWTSCEEIDKIYKELKQHNEAIEFWTEMRDRFTEKMGWNHEKTLNSCKYLSHHSREIGINKEPAEFTRVKDFITENIENVNLDEEWNRGQIITCLFQIAYLSRNDESKSKSASDAITLLNLMNISFSGMDLSNIRIPNANLSNSIIDGANFTGANLDGVNFTNSMLGDCVFDEGYMNGVKFGIPHDILEGHGSTVNSVCSIQGPNGENWLASGSGDNTIRIWDITTGNQIKKLGGHTESVMSVCSIQGPNAENWLASGSSDETIRIWDIATGNQIKILKGHLRGVNSVCSIQVPNGENWLASGSNDKTIRIWDIATGNQIKKLGGHTGGVESVCSIQGPNGENWLASGSGSYGSNDKTIRIWDIATGNQIKILEGHTGYVLSVCSIQGPNGEKWLASGSSDKTIRIWDMVTGNQIKVLNGHTSYIKSVCSIQGPNGENWLASGSWDNTIRIWDVATGNQIKILEGHTESVYSVCSIQGPNGEKWLASGSNDNTIRIWDVATGNQIKILEGHVGDVQIVCSIQGPNGEKWLASFDEITIRIWDVTTGNQINTLQKSEVTYTHGKNLVRKGNPDEIIATFNKLSHAMNLIDTNTISDGKTVQIVGPRKLQGGNIRLRNVKGLSQFNKRILLSIGAVSFDEDFVKYCDEGKYTKFQAQMMAECYENGWGVEKDIKKSYVWTGKAENFEKLNRFAQEGSKGAFSVLLEFAEMIENEKHKYPQVVSIVAECYENGWGVEVNAELSLKWKIIGGKAENFERLKQLAQQGSKDAFNVLMEFAVMKECVLDYSLGFGIRIGEKHKYPQAVSIVAECYENGWGVEMNAEMAAEWRKKVAQ